MSVRTRWAIGFVLWAVLLLLAFRGDRWVYRNVSGPVCEKIGYKTWRFGRPGGGRALLLQELLLLLKRMGHFFFVVLIAVTMGVVARRWRQAGVLVLCVGVTALVGQVVLKNAVAKVRPDGVIERERAQRILQEDGADELILVDGEYRNTGRAEFRTPFGGDLDGLTLPSGHTALAFAVAVALGAFLGRGRWWFYLLACAVGASRMAIGEHFLSDVVAGAGVGIACTRAFLAIPRFRGLRSREAG